MKSMRGMLALLLCAILAISPCTAALSEELLEEGEFAVELEEAPEGAPIELEAAEPGEPAAEAGGPAAEESEAGSSEDSGQNSTPPPELTLGDTSEEADPTLDAPEPGDAIELRVKLASFAMGFGEKRKIEASFSDGSSYPISYASSAPEIASVSEDGTVAAQKLQGTAEIALTSEYGSATVSVSVGRKPTGVKLSAARKVMGAPDGEWEDRLQLGARLSPEDACSKLSFSSSNKAVATVDENGVVTAHKRGKATITVQTYNKKKASVKLTVKPAPQSVALSGCAPELGLGETGWLSAATSSGSAGGCAFESSDPDVLTVDPATGEFRAASTGSATLRVETYNGKAASVDVRVKNAPESLTLGLSEATLGVGEYMDLPAADPGEGCAGGVRFTSGSSRAVITSDGRIKAKKTGDVTITAETYNGCAAAFLLHVVKAPTKLILSARHTTLGVGEALQLSHRFKPSGAESKLSYESSKPDIASVSEEGVVTAAAPGRAKISAKTYNKKGSSVTFTVVPEPASISLPPELALGQGEKYALQPALSPEGSGGGIYYSVDDPGVATIDELTGEITAVAAGETVARARLYNGLSAECRLAVRSAPTGISLQDANFILSVKDTYQLQPPVLEGEAAASGNITYKSSSKCVNVSQTGLITAVKTGKATITVSTYNKKKATLKVTVKSAPKKIAFAEDSRRLFIDHEFTPEVSLSNKAVPHYSLSSSDPSVAAIMEDGRSVRGVSGGTVTITATSFNGKTDTMQVWVPFLPERVGLDPASPELGAGDSTTLRAVIPEGQGAELHYESSDESIASVEVVDNETITVIAHSAGEADITVRSQNGKEGTARLTVFQAPTALCLTPSRAGRSLDEKQLQLRWSFGGAGEGGRVAFSSGDESIATVDASGLVTFHSAGSVRITAKSYNGHAANCALTIGSTPTRMFFEQAEYAVALGDTVQLPASFEGGCESYALSAADGAILSTSGDTVTALTIGATEVTAVSRSGLRANCAVRVVEAPTGLELEPASAELIAFVGQSLQLSARVLPDGVGSVRYFSTDPHVATVDSATGLVLPLSSGDAVIRAVTYDGTQSAECRVHVKLPLEGMKIGIDPGHQARGNLGKERKSPNSKATKNKCAYSSAGVAHVSEHKINLQVSLKLRDALERMGAEVYMTRETANVNISNKQRAIMMNNYHVDLVLRIHCNSWTDGSAHGFSVTRRKTCAYKDKDVDAKQGSGKTLMANEKKLGQSIVKYYKKETGAKNRGLGTSDEYTMNNWSKVPCLLMELGFMTHPTEGRKLVQAAYQEKMVRGLVKGICDYAGSPIPVEW